MSQGLKNAAGRGMSNITLTAAQKALLTEGDIEGLLELHHSQFGSARMAEDDEDDDDDEDDEDDEDESDEDESEDDEDEDDEDEESGDDKGKSKRKPKVDPKDERIRELSGEAKKYRLRARESRNRVAELERENAELRRGKAKAKPKGKDDEDENDEPQPDPETERKLERAQRALEDAAIRTEFLSNNTFAWKNPKAALRLLDLSDVEVDEDGEVVGLEEAIEQLAKDEPYLLKEKADARPQTKKRKPTGQPSGGRRKSGNANRDALLSKYPALRR